jgi:ferredoxin
MGPATARTRVGGDVLIEVDRDLCEANARCVKFAPEVFSLDDDEELHIAEPGPDVDPTQVAKAVAACPRNALTSDLPPFVHP